MSHDVKTAPALGCSDAILIIDSQRGVIVQWSEAAQEVFGYSAEEALGLLVEKLFPQGFGMQARQEHRGPLIGRTKSGRRLHVDAFALRLALPGQPHAYALIVLEDRDWRHHMEAELRASEERFRALYDDNPTIYLTIGQDNLICSVNRFGAAFLGYTPEELEGRPVAMLFPAPEREQVHRQLAEAIAHLGEPLRWELRKQKKSGEIIWVRDIARAVQGASGELLVLVVCEEITALKTMEATLTAQNLRLEHLDVMKNNFVGAVSHELRTPLTSIRGYTEFLEDELEGPLTPGQREFVAQLQANTERLQRLVDDLLDFSRLEVGEFKLQLHPCDLVGRVREVAEGLRPRVEGAGFALELELPTRPLWLALDEIRIAQVLTNLIDNAIKFSPPHGSIRVRLQVEASQARCEISDQGLGIGPADQLRIFDRFVQLDGGNRRQTGGAGLGLAIVKGIIEAHGGRAGVVSVPGAGASFYFTLPCSELEGPDPPSG